MQQVAVFSLAVDPRLSEELKDHWRRFVVLGVALVMLGVVALGSVGLATIASVLVFGWIKCRAACSIGRRDAQGRRRRRVQPVE